MVPARRGKNFRSGDLAEQLGLYLLQSMALVAPVPRTEDVGIDVVCTLISEYDQYSYLAEDSFYVQIKSDSIREIEYSDVEVQWLTNLKLPLFVAVVDKAEMMVLPHDRRCGKRENRCLHYERPHPLGARLSPSRQRDGDIQTEQCAFYRGQQRH